MSKHHSAQPQAASSNRPGKPLVCRPSVKARVDGPATYVRVDTRARPGNAPQSRAVSLASLSFPFSCLLCLNTHTHTPLSAAELPASSLPACQTPHLCNHRKPYHSSASTTDQDPPSTPSSVPLPSSARVSSASARTESCRTSIDAICSRRETAQPSPTQHPDHAAPRRTVPYCSVLYGAVRYGTLLYSTAVHPEHCTCRVGRPR